MTQKVYHIDKKFLLSSSIFYKKFKVALLYLFNFVILHNTDFYFKRNFKLKIDQKTCTFKNLEEFSQKPVATLYKAISL